GTPGRKLRRHLPFGRSSCIGCARTVTYGTRSPMKPETEFMEGPTQRQRDVLDAVLRLLVEEGDKITMASVARRASCSKETLYKWFGDRDGLLTAAVKWQASKVRVSPVDPRNPDLQSLTE